MKFHVSLVRSVPSGLRAASFLRIAIPSWRWDISGRMKSHAESNVSKDELEELFGPDLKSNSDWRKTLTDGEARDLDRSKAVRGALNGDPRLRT